MFLRDFRLTLAKRPEKLLLKTQPVGHLIYYDLGKKGNVSLLSLICTKNTIPYFFSKTYGRGPPESRLWILHVHGFQLTFSS